MVPWRPLPKALEGKVAEAVNFIESKLAADPLAAVTFKEVMHHLGWKERQDFNKRIRDHDDFINALEDEGIEEWGKGKWPSALRRAL